MTTDCYRVYFVFTFAAFVSLSSKSRHMMHHFSLFVLSVTVFSVSTYMLVNQVKFLHESQLESSHRLIRMENNDTKQFCLWTAIPDGNCGKGSLNNTFLDDNAELCSPERHLVCIPMTKKCDGMIDMFSNGNGSYRFFVRQTDKASIHGGWIRAAPDETYCGDSRFLVKLFCR